MAINLETKNSQAKDAINTWNAQYYISKGQQKEVEDAKNAIVNKFPLRVSSNKDILNYILWSYYDL